MALQQEVGGDLGAQREGHGVLLRRPDGVPQMRAQGGHLRAQCVREPGGVLFRRGEEVVCQRRAGDVDLHRKAAPAAEQIGKALFQRGKVLAREQLSGAQAHDNAPRFLVRGDALELQAVHRRLRGETLQLFLPKRRFGHGFPPEKKAVIPGMRPGAFPWRCPGSRPSARRAAGPWARGAAGSRGGTARPRCRRRRCPRPPAGPRPGR